MATKTARTTTLIAESKLTKPQTAFLEALREATSGPDGWCEVYSNERRTATALEEKGLIRLRRIPSIVHAGKTFLVEAQLIQEAKTEPTERELVCAKLHIPAAATTEELLHALDSLLDLAEIST